MNSITAFIQPFSMEQKIVIFHDNEKEDINISSLDNFSDIVSSYASQYDINSISLVGNKDYLLKFKKDILSKYSNLNVNIVQRG